MSWLQPWSGATASATKCLSDYTFAVRDGDKLLNVGKAYSGLTDVEIAEMTEWFKAHTIEDQGFRR